MTPPLFLSSGSARENMTQNPEIATKVLQSGHVSPRKISSIKSDSG